MLTAFHVLFIAIVTSATTLEAGDTLTIEAPASVSAGEMIVIPIEGAAPEWLHEMKVKHYPRDGTTTVVGRSLQPDSTPWIAFHANRPGKYAIFVTAKDADGVVVEAEAEIVVEGEPQPDPNPIPPVPVPIEALSILVIMESGQRTASGAAMLGTLMAHFRSTEDRYHWRIVDQDVKDGSTNESPTWLQPYKKAREKSKVKLPALVVTVLSPVTGKVSSVVAVKPLGGLSGAEAVALVKKWGG